MPKKPEVNRSEFVRQHLHLDTKGIIAAAKKQGVKIAPSTVYQARAVAKAHKKGDAMRRRGLATKRRKVVPTSALETHIHEHQHALSPKAPHFEELKHEIGEFMIAFLAGLRQLVHEEIRAHFKKLGG